MFALDLNQSSNLVDLVGTPHEEAIAALLHAGVAQGFGDDTFRPHDPLTRGQFATMLAGLLDDELGLGLDTDLDPDRPPADVEAAFPDAGLAHAAAIGLLGELGILRGFADRTVRPGEPLSRAQAASMLVRGHHLRAN